MFNQAKESYYFVWLLYQHKCLTFFCDIIQLIGAEPHGTWSKRFYPQYGYCWEITNYTISNEIQIVTRNIQENDKNVLLVFLTDKRMKKNFDIHLPSQSGVAIKMQKGKMTDQKQS